MPARKKPVAARQPHSAANDCAPNACTLATAAIINEAVDDAVTDHVSYIAVPNSNYDLLYGTVAPISSDGVTFEVIDGGTAITMNADCRQGTLNGRDPNTAAEAELLNAACQVAYGST